MVLVETYTRDRGSNMDCIEYKDGTTIDEILEDLEHYDDWDYAYVTFSGMFSPVLVEKDK